MWTRFMWLILAALLILWVIGVFIAPFGGNLIHLLLAIAFVILLLNLLTGKREV